VRLVHDLPLRGIYFTRAPLLWKFLWVKRPEDELLHLELKMRGLFELLENTPKAGEQNQDSF
jgi:hypothetical protein